MEEPSPLLQSPKKNDEAVRLTNYCNGRISSDCVVSGAICVRPNPPAPRIAVFRQPTCPVPGIRSYRHQPVAVLRRRHISPRDPYALRRGCPTQKHDAPTLWRRPIS
jgi:hypothetical protein